MPDMGITPHLWFDTQAKEAAEFYTTLFPDSRIDTVRTLRDTPSGDCDVVYFQLAGQPFQAISAGPLFSFNPSCNFMVACSTQDEVDTLWNALVEGGTVMMELQRYDFSEHYGWLADRYGLSWQIGLFEGATQTITPSLMFVGDNAGKAAEAIDLYTSVFSNSKVNDSYRYPAGAEPDKEGTIMYAGFTLAGVDFSAMDSAHEHNFQFNEAVSFMVHCDTQEQIDEYWAKLSAVPEAEQCGWLKDRFGVSWQIVPRALDKMMQDADDAGLARVTQAFLPMKKLDIATLEEAYSRS